MVGVLMKKEYEYHLNKIKIGLNKKYNLPMGFILSIILLTIILSGVLFYFFGRYDSIYEINNNIEKQKTVNFQIDMIKHSKDYVQDYFFKYLMIKIMIWFPYVISALLIGWILHGVF